MLDFLLVCNKPVDAQENAETRPSNLSSNFLVGDVITYICNGNLIPKETASICMDTGNSLAEWTFNDTTALPTCGKISQFCNTDACDNNVLLMYGNNLFGCNYMQGILHLKKNMPFKDNQ